ncbi:MAG: Ni/Fe hydrogenase subunit alpha, partial [Acidithiobacillus sp.]
RVGGFHRAPSRAEVAALQEQVRAALPGAEALVAWTASLNLPNDAQDFVSVALRHPDEYPMNEGRIVSSDGLDIPISDYEAHFAEHQEPHSTALYASLEGRPYLVGPLARLNLNLDRLHTPVREALGRTGIAFPSRNMFHSIVARAAEIHHALLEVTRLLEDYSEPEAPFAPATPRSGTGHGCTEAPRGLLWHRYDLDGAGQVRHARIVPPTSQNQARIEADLRRSLETLGLDRDDEALRQQAEMVIRNYDPCISCATHFLTVRVGRR